MCQLLQLLWQHLGIAEESFEAWLTRKQRNYPPNVLRSEFCCHVASFLLFLSAAVWIIVGLVVHHRVFPQEEATLGAGVVTMMAVITMMLVMFPLKCLHCHRHRNAFILVGALHIVCAVLYVVVWTLSCALNNSLLHISGLLLGIGSLQSGISAMIYFFPEAFLNRCHGNNAGQQPQGPPPYAQAVANQQPQGPFVLPWPHPPVPQGPPPPYPSVLESSQQSLSSSQSQAHQLTTTTQDGQDEEWEDVEEEGEDEGTAGGGAVSQRRSRQGKRLGRPRNSGQSRSRSRSRGGGRSLGRGRKTRSRGKTRSTGAGRSSSRGRGGGTTNQAAGGSRTRSRSLRELTKY